MILEWTTLTGKKIWANSLHVQRTYGHVYEGMPSHKTNDRYLAVFPDRVHRIFHGPFPVHVLEPERKPGNPDDDELLPSYWVAAECYSGPMDKTLALVWFQDEPFPVPSPKVLRALQELDWEAHAEEFDP